MPINVPVVPNSSDNTAPAPITTTVNPLNPTDKSTAVLHVIVNEKFEAQWGLIAGDINNQLDLQAALRVWYHVIQNNGTDMLNRSKLNFVGFTVTDDAVNSATKVDITSQLDGKQPLDGDLSAIAALTGTGIATRTGSNTWSLDTTVYTPSTRSLTINGTSQDLSSDRTWSVGTVTGTGTANYLSYWSGTSALTADTTSGGQLYWDPTNHTLALGGTTTVAGNKLRMPIDPTGNMGMIQMGAGTFGGNSGGNYVAIGASLGFAGSYFQCQLNGTNAFVLRSDGRMFSGNSASNAVVWSATGAAGGFVFNGTNTVQDVITAQVSGTVKAYLASSGMLILGGAISGNLNGFLNIPVAPTATTNYGLVNLGTKPFDGATSGFFVGGANGTFVAINAASTNPDFLRFQFSGVDKLLVDGTGKLAAGSTSALDLHIASTTHATKGKIYFDGDIYPETDNTFYIGKNSSSTPFAFKGVILKDTTNGTYYRFESVNGVATLTAL